MLKLRSLHYSPATAETTILRNVCLEAEVGTPVLIAGASGSGKTSLMDLISGLSSEQSGQVLWNDRVMTRSQRRWLCGLVFQFPERHFLGLTVGQELRLGHRRVSSDKLQSVLAQVGLESISHQLPPERLSGGQQRRLALAVQLLRGAEVLLLDEPTAGLDWSVRNDVLNLLAELSLKRVVIVVTHEPQLFEEWSCDRYQLRDGGLEPVSTLPPL